MVALAKDKPKGTGPKDDPVVDMVSYLIAAPFTVALWLATTLPVAAFGAFVAQHYWRWFVQPVFDRAEPRLFVLVGWAALIRLLIFQTDRRASTDEEKRLAHDIPRRLFDRVVTVAILWLFGWVAHLCDGWLMY